METAVLFAEMASKSFPTKSATTVTVLMVMVARAVALLRITLRVRVLRASATSTRPSLQLWYLRPFRIKLAT